jgi:hypothetical protein
MPNTQGSFTDLRFTFAELDTKYAQGTPPASPFFNENVWGIFPGSSQPWVNVPVGTSFGLKLTSNVSMVGGGWSLTVKVSTDGTLNNARTYSFDGAANGSSVLFISSTNTGGYGWYSVESVQCTTSITTPGVAYLTNMYVGITTGGVLDVPTSSTVNGFYPLAGIGAAELSVSPQIYESCRINAASCLFQNTTSSLNKDGTVKAYVVQTVNNAPWDTITNQLVAANDAAVILRYNDYLEKGMYTFFQPQMSRTDFVDSTGRTSIGYSPAFSLGTDNYYYFALMSPTSAAQQVTLTYVVHHEARNTSMLYPIVPRVHSTRTYDRRAFLVWTSSRLSKTPYTWVLWQLPQRIWPQVHGGELAPTSTRSRTRQLTTLFLVIDLRQLAAGRSCSISPFSDLP